MKHFLAAAVLVALFAGPTLAAEPLRRVDVAGDTLVACGTRSMIQVDPITGAIAAAVDDRTWFCGALDGVAVGRVTTIASGQPTTASLVARRAGDFAVLGEPIGPSLSFGFIASDGSRRIWWGRNADTANTLDAYALDEDQLEREGGFEVPYDLTSLDAYPWGPVALGTDRRVRSYDSAGELQWELGLGHSASRIFAEPGYVVAIGSGSATVIDAITGERRGVIASPAQAAAVHDRMLYLSRPSGAGGTLDVYDLSGAAPELVGSVDTLAFAQDIAFTRDGRVFAATGSGPMLVDVGISEPTAIPTYTPVPTETPIFVPTDTPAPPTPTPGVCRWECSNCLEVCE